MNRAGCAHFIQEGGLPAMEASSDLANLAIEGVLELSADAHIERNMAARGSSDFHRLTGAIAAYGNALAVLVALQEREELHGMIAELNLPASMDSGSSGCGKRIVPFVSSRWRRKRPPTPSRALAASTSGKAKPIRALRSGTPDAPR